MIIKKNLSLKVIYEFTGHHLYWLTAWMVIVTSVFYFGGSKYMAMPWLPISLIGTAVAFYVGFKNAQSYNRVWEARQIWGGLVNDSRKLGTMIKNLRSDEAETTDSGALRKQIIYRHIAYLYQLREQLLEPTPWEHVSQDGRVGYYNRKRRERNFGYYEKELEEIANNSYLAEEEQNSLQNYNNKATQLLDRQTRDVQQLFEAKSINLMQQSGIQKVINDFYEAQGRAERIKRFPFPRTYASFSFVFVCIFIFLLPFGVVGEFGKMGGAFVWLAVPVGVIVGWTYVVMELIGDYSENPFEGLHSDIPMLSISRAIEIDLLQMLGEKDIPKPIAAKEGVLF